MGALVLGASPVTALANGKPHEPIPAPGAAWGPPRVYEDLEFESVDAYRVTAAGDLVPRPPHGSDEERVWQTLLRVTGRDFAGEVLVQYLVGDLRRSDTLAYVYQQRDPRHWVVAVNLAWSERAAELVPTLVHEYAHLITLSLDQVEGGVWPCPRLILPEGCAAPDSAIWAFQQRFWDDYEDAPTPHNEDWDVADAFSADHPEHFVSDYAAMNVVEDIAESFMVFVMEERPAGETVADQKIAFFYDYPEFVAIRERVRAEFGPELGFIP